MRNKLIIILTICCMLFACLGVIGCGETSATSNGGNATNAQIMAIYNSYLANAEVKGETPLSYEDWLATIKGEKGEKGDKGDQGEKGIQGEKGDKGDQGEQGVQGEKGDKGDQGEQGVQGEKGDKGDQGENGLDGKSAYQIWLENGYTGTQSDFLNWLKGENGANGVDGTDGKDGVDGKDGQDGADGKDGVGIADMYITTDGYLMVKYTNSSEYVNLGKVVPTVHEHSFGDWLIYSDNDTNCEDRFFYRECSSCGEVVFKKGTEHSYQANYSFDKIYHYKECKNCEQVSNKGEHTAGNDGCCTVCGVATTATVGILYKLSLFGTFYEVVGYEGASKSVMIADTYEGKPVKTICEKAFYYNDNITSVIIPESVTSIGYEAFRNCSLLTSIVIPDSVTSIGDWAFCECYSLTSIEIPESVTIIGEYAFLDCDSLTSIVIPESVTSIGFSAFSDCDSLASIKIPNSVTSIGNSAFSSCSSLTSVTFGKNSQLTSIDYSAFYDCDSLTSIEIPNSVTTIGIGAFSGCSSLEFTIEGNCKYLGNKNNKYLCLIEVTSQNYSSYTINNNCKVIAYGAFSNCTRLTSIEIPESVTSIGFNVFYECSSLTRINYSGTKSQWNVISKGCGGIDFAGATVYCSDGTISIY